MAIIKGLRLSADCMHCILTKQMKSADKIEDEVKRAEYIQKVMEIISQANLDEAAPVALQGVNELYKEYFHEEYSFDDIKRTYNQLMLEREDELRLFINSSPDPVKTALKYSRVGNYIDFGGLGSVDNAVLNRLLQDADKEYLDEDVYHQFCEELRQAHRVLLLTDNCGEIVLDKLLIEQIQKRYPDLSVSVMVRGKAILNDATMEDAKMVGLTNLVTVIGNGTQIVGTFYKALSDEAKSYIDNADIIISKGQANFETLNGCGFNVYYLFLCKCPWFMRQFGLKQFSGVFVRDRDVYEKTNK